jgi:thiamine transport system ATP-binding protein
VTEPTPGGLRVTDLAVSRGVVEVLHTVSLTIEPGEIVALQGPSGSGKSTLLRAIAGLLPIASGRVEVGGQDVTEVATHRRGVGMVFQDEQLFGHLDVAGNVGFGLRMQNIERRQRAPRVAEMLTMVGMTNFGGRRVHTLSGGEAKRVAVARSLAPAPRLLLLDEPLTGLDDALHDQLCADIPAWIRAQQLTALWVTHSGNEAHAIADRVLGIDDL